MDIFELVSGVRMNYGYFRVGGLSYDVPAGFEQAVEEFVKLFPAKIQEYHDFFMGNPIFETRTRGVGVIDRETALDTGLTGPNLRASGVDLDWRTARPFEGYEDYVFDVIRFLGGDKWSSFVVRCLDMVVSLMGSV